MFLLGNNIALKNTFCPTGLSSVVGRGFRAAQKAWSVCAGIGGQIAPEWLVSFVRNGWSVWSGIAGQIGPEYA